MTTIEWYYAGGIVGAFVLYRLLVVLGAVVIGEGLKREAGR